MCAYSVISEYYTRPPDSMATPPIQQMDGESVRLLKDIADKLDKLDKRLGDIECMDPTKAKFKKALNKRIRETAKKGK